MHPLLGAVPVLHRLFAIPLIIHAGELCVVPAQARGMSAATTAGPYCFAGSPFPRVISRKMHHLRPIFCPGDRRKAVLCGRIDGADGAAIVPKTKALHGGKAKAPGAFTLSSIVFESCRGRRGCAEGFCLEDALGFGGGVVPRNRVRVRRKN